jgi:hypothetical protein
VKITFEGETLDDILDQLTRVLLAAPPAAVKAAAVKAAPAPIVAKPAEKSAEEPLFHLDHRMAAKPKRERSAKQLENDERLRAAAKAKIAAKVMAKKIAAGVSDPMVPPIPPPPKTAEGMDPAEVVQLRQKTIEELQAAYANGFQKEVFELLSRFGNGAKSFRELPPDAFVPIREAIDNGALT